MKLTIEFILAHCAHPTDMFVETGSGLGGTLSIAAAIFKECLSIESNKERASRVSANFAEQKHVNVIHGDSSIWLAMGINGVRDKSVTFWLDAHYGGDFFPQPQVECPLLGELKAIMSVSWKTKPVIMIDDARYFFPDFWKTSLANPYTREKWPTYEEIMAATIGFDCEVFKVKNKPKILILR